MDPKGFLQDFLLVELLFLASVCGSSLWTLEASTWNRRILEAWSSSTPERWFWSSSQAGEPAWPSHYGSGPRNLGTSWNQEIWSRSMRNCGTPNLAETLELLAILPGNREPSEKLWIWWSCRVDAWISGSYCSNGVLQTNWSCSIELYGVLRCALRWSFRESNLGTLKLANGNLLGTSTLGP